jgi:hypothetical protein
MRGIIKPMDLNKIINIFNANTNGLLRRSDITDAAMQKDPAVKTIKNIFDRNLDGTLNADELSLLEKFSILDGQNDISINDIKLLSALNGSATQTTSGDVNFLKTTRYSSQQGNTVSTFGTNGAKTSDTIINPDGSVTKTGYASDNSQTITEYTVDFKIKTQTKTKANGLVIKHDYNNGSLVQKYETFIDGSSTTTLYRNDSKINQVIKADPNGNILSAEEYDYDDNGKKASIVGYNALGEEISRTLYNSDNSKTRVEYNENGDITKREVFNKQSKVTSSFVQNQDGTSVTATYDYSGGNTTATIRTFDAQGLQISEQISTTDRKGNKTVTLGGAVIQKDIVDSDKTSVSTIYAADGTITSATYKDKKGAVTKVDYYTYVNGQTDTITEKDATGKIIGTGKYAYDNPAITKSLDHFDANGVLLDRAIWNLDGTKNITKYNTTNLGLTGTLTENYGSNDKLTDTLFVANNGVSLASQYSYNSPAAGDMSVVTTNRDADNQILSILNYTEHSNGSNESYYYNADKTLLLEKDIVDKLGNTVRTSYTNGAVDEIEKLDSYGKLKSSDDYIYTNGALTSIAHYDASEKLTGTTVYDAFGNTKEYNSLGQIVAAKTTDQATKIVTEESYKYITSGDKYTTIKTSLNSKVQSVKKIITHTDNSSEISTYNANYIMTQNDKIAADGSTQSTIYDTAAGKILRVVNKNAAGDILLTNEYSYKQSTPKLVDTISCFDSNNKLTQKIQFIENNQRIITTYNTDGSIKTVITYDQDDNVISAA